MVGLKFENKLILLTMKKLTLLLLLTSAFLYKSNATNLYSWTNGETGSPANSIVAKINGPAVIEPNNSFNYSVPSVQGAASYNWHVPQESSIVTGDNTKSIKVLFSEHFVAGGIIVTVTDDLGNTQTYSIKVSIPQ